MKLRNLKRNLHMRLTRDARFGETANLVIDPPDAEQVLRPSGGTQNPFPASVPGMDLRAIVLTPYLAKLLTESASIKTSGSASDLAEVRAKLKTSLERRRASSGEAGEKLGSS